jgi:hypothetical protein
MIRHSRRTPQGGTAPDKRDLHTRYEQFLMRYIGPADVGDLNEPARALRKDHVCPVCGQPFGAHTKLHDVAHGYIVCPVEPNQRDSSSSRPC